MLILTRRVGEAMKLGEEMMVTVLGVRGNQVRNGIYAPKSVAIQREEIYSTAVTDRTPETNRNMVRPRINITAIISPVSDNDSVKNDLSMRR